MNISPERAVIIDDDPKMLCADKLGANVIQVCQTGEYQPEFFYNVSKVKNIPSIIEKIMHARARM